MFSAPLEFAALAEQHAARGLRLPGGAPRLLRISAGDIRRSAGGSAGSAGGSDAGGSDAADRRG